MKKRIVIVALVISLILSSHNAIGFASANPKTTEESGASLDYSSHTDPNEEWYTTVLGDPSKLSDGEQVFATQEEAANWSWREFGGLVKDETWRYDVRSLDISGLDLSSVDNANDLSFDSNTVWPKVLPEGFDPAHILEYNKNPGLGIRALHEKGITGTGVGIAIIDGTLLLDHEQYKDNLMYYERIHNMGFSAEVHGPAVASIAVGNTIGVAPGAKLYYIASTFGHNTDTGFEYDASIIADAILRVLDINQYLPENEKIRVISISMGYNENDKGYAEITNAIEKANEQNIFVVTTDTWKFYKFGLFGMDREYSKDPDDFNSYTPVSWMADQFYDDPNSFQNLILFPMGSGTYASCTGTENYEIAYTGGLSWSVPWCAGLYALCCQAKPDITPQEFIDALESTGVTIDHVHDGQTYKFGKIVNPAGIIEKLQQSA